MQCMKKKLIAGLAGSLVLTLMHEVTRKLNPRAPRMDLLGMQAIGKVLKAAHLPIPRRPSLYRYTLLADIVGNALYYSLSGANASRHLVSNSTMAGISAGISAVKVPQIVGLNDDYSNRTKETQWLTVLLYTVGGLAAGLTMKMLQDKKPA